VKTSDKCGPIALGILKVVQGGVGMLGLIPDVTGLVPVVAVIIDLWCRPVTARRVRTHVLLCAVIGLNATQYNGLPLIILFKLASRVSEVFFMSDVNGNVR
jgi:hypothetical protein